MPPDPCIFQLYFNRHIFQPSLTRTETRSRRGRPGKGRPKAGGASRSSERASHDSLVEPVRLTSFASLGYMEPLARRLPKRPQTCLLSIVTVPRPLSWLELGGMGWSGFGAVTILVTKRRFGPSRERLGSRNLLIPLCPGRDSNPHEGNPQPVLCGGRWLKTHSSLRPAPKL